MRAYKDPTDFSVIVKRRDDSTNRWRWEIHRTGRSSPVKSSGFEFVTMSCAKQAGVEALTTFLTVLGEDAIA